jgi:zinc protease
MSLRTRIPAVVLIVFSAFAHSQTAAQKAAPPSSARAKQARPPKFFPYPVHERKLPNGLHVIVIPTPEFKDMVTYATPVFAGSRNEMEGGKTGLAHLFEHMMFRHEYGDQEGGYNEMIRRLGAYNNAFTNEDMTFYHPTTFSSNLIGPVKRGPESLPGIVELEASRFKGLKVDTKTFQVEAGAVLGEYRRIYSFPFLKILEALLPKAFPDHPYGHTVIGTQQDVKDMPQAADAAWRFFDDYYRPNTVAIVVVGDVQADAVFREVEQRYADWKPKPTRSIPPPSPPPGEKRVHAEDTSEVAPRLVVGYYSPAADPGSVETAVIQVLPELLTSRSAPLFQKLRYQKQTVTDLSTFSDGMNVQPNSFTLSSELMLDRFNKEGKTYPAEVEKDMISGLEDLKSFSRQPHAARTLDVVKSKVRNDLLGALNSTGSIATIFSSAYQYNRDAYALDRMMAAIQRLRPADIDAFARKYFQPGKRLIATLWNTPGAQSAPAKEGN